MNQPTGTGPESLKSAIMRIFALAPSTDGEKASVGVGFLVDDQHVLTCAHVVYDALALAEDARLPEAAVLPVDLPLLPGPSGDGAVLTASVERLIPRQPSGAGDVAVLRLAVPITGTQPVRLAEADGYWNHRAGAFGLPDGRPAGVWHSGVLKAPQGDGWVQMNLDPASGGYVVSRGFSGGPVWDETLGAVVGMMVVAEAGLPAVSYLIPTTGLATAWPPLRELIRPPSPFRSLTPFEESDHAIFHGRRADSERIAHEVGAKRTTTLIGPSGCGKSSLVRAGVIPRRRAAGDIPLLLRPTQGSSPLHVLAAELLPLLVPEITELERLRETDSLADRLARHGLLDLVPRVLARHHGARLLVVIDQFEDLLDLPDDAVRAFANTLAGERPPADVAVVATLRADFVESVQADERLRSLVSPTFDSLLPMSTEQLREAITKPVEQIAGVSFEDGLVERILADTGNDARVLPLLAFTLDRLWSEQHGRALTFQTYDALGGVHGALGAYAGQAWAHVEGEDKSTARGLLARLVRLPIGAEHATRRVVPRAELGDVEWRVVQRLAAARLIILNTAQGAHPEDALAEVESIELAHEVLITAWPELAQQVSADKAFLIWRETLRHDLARWHDTGNAPDRLPTKDALAEAEKWLPARAAELSKSEGNYLDRGRAYRRAQTRKRGALFTGLVVVVVSALLLGSLFWYAQQQSSERQALANSRALAQAAQDSADYDPALSVMTALAAYQTSQTQEARNQLLREYLAYSSSDRVLSGLPGTIAVFNTSRDGNVVFAGTDLGRATLFVHAATGAVRSEAVPAGHVLYAMVSPDGRRAAFVNEDGTAGWFDVNQNAVTPVGPVHKLPAVTGLLTYYDGPQDAAAMSADGTLVAVPTGDSLVWWNLDTGTGAGSVPAPPNAGNGLWISEDKRTLLMRTYDEQDPTNARTGLVAVDMATGQTRTVVTPEPDQDVLVSGDRSAVAVCQNLDSGAVVRLVRVADNAQEGRPYTASSSTCGDLVAADATGRRVVIKDDEGNPILVDLDQGAKVFDITAAPGSSDSLASYASDLISSGGTLLLAGHGDAQITYYEVPTSPNILDVDSQVLTKDGGRTISLLNDGSLQLRPSGSDSDQLLASATSPRQPWNESDNELRLNSDRSLIADREAQNVVTIRDTTTLRQTARITTVMPPNPPPPSASEDAAPGHDNLDNYFDYFFDWTGRLVTVSGGQVQQWDPRTGRQLARFDATAFLSTEGDDVSDTQDVGVGPYPAPNQVSVLFHGDPVIRIVDLTTGRTVTTVKAATDVYGIQFDPSGRYFALLRQASVVELWQRNPLQKELGPLYGLTGINDTPWWAGFLDGNGRYAIAANDSIRIYQMGQQAPTDSYQFGHPDGSQQQNPYVFMDVSNDARTVLYAADNGIGGPLALDPATWERNLCRIIGYRSFTSDEQAGLPAPIPAQLVCMGTQ